MKKNAAIFLIAALLPLAPAQALCSYGGKLYAKPTFAQESRDARWVVRAKVLSGETHRSGKGDDWTLYRLRTIESFKGKPPAQFTFFTERNSGGFYLDKGSRPDVGADYLLFLNPARKLPRGARGALEVNYSCGQSKPWTSLKPAEAKRLRGLAGR